MADQAGTTGASPAPGAPAGSDGGNAGGGERAGTLLGEFSPDGTLGDQDSSFILSTLFGEGNAKSGGDQGPGDKSSGDQSGVAAPSPAGSTAAQGSGEPAQELPAFPGTGSQQQEQQPAGGTATSQSQPQGDKPSGSPTPPAGQQQQTGGLSPEEKLELQNLRNSIPALQNMILQLQEQVSGKGNSGTGTQPGQQPGGGAQDPAQQVINLAAPPDVVEAIFDTDNPTRSQAGINHLISATATATLQQVMKAVGPMIDQRLADFQGQQSYQSSQEKIQQEYYAAFPHHNNPLFKQLIAQESADMWAAMPHLQWNEDSRNALGARVQAKLTSLGFNPQPPANGSAASTAAPAGQEVPQERPPVANGSNRPAPMLGNGTRPQANNDGAPSFIAATLG